MKNLENNRIKVFETCNKPRKLFCLWIIDDDDKIYAR